MSLPRAYGSGLAGGVRVSRASGLSRALAAGAGGQVTPEGISISTRPDRRIYASDGSDVPPNGLAGSVCNASDGGMIGLENRNARPQVLRKCSVLYLRYLRRPAALKMVSSETLGSPLSAIFW